MLRRRLLMGDSPVETMPQPIFYAPLTVDKIPTIAWDGNFGLYVAGNGSVTSNGLYIPSQLSIYGLMWKCQILPIENALTFNMWINPNWTYGLNFISGLWTTNNEPFTGLMFARHPSWMDRTTIFSNNIDRAVINASFGVPPANTWTFLTWTFLFDSGNLTMKVYWNGIKKAETVSPNDALIRSSLERVTLGAIVGNDNCPGTYRHYSIYPAMTDEQISALYNNGGIPI
jgi:hypothetical protein